MVLQLLHASTAAAGRGYGWFSSVFVCLSVYRQDILKTAAARITKLDTGLQMFHDES